ncbi:penicillin binding protein PBP4B [Glaciecola sp. XM2]|uniref:penicillin binding protein PBP4B n=1 Tax=Glaciecola sp. XM2 TaxID=1914931 RepID=UPI001BDF3314|nr:penicillin binding protein PBP4B [Glaciecola sp. XM2]MBT1452232.1 penicillin binding protein PBP4B [Glaciecola sp. XM2]
MSYSVLRSVFILASAILVASCVSSSYTQLPSANYSFRVKSLVMHFTAVDYQTSVDLLVDEGFVSSHYLVPQSNDPSYPYSDLKILQLVDETERAWHAGTSYWQGRTGLNDSSIGIEIVNTPSCFDDENAIEAAGMASKAEHGPNRLCIFPDFDPKQIELVIQLSQDILARNPDISPTAVVGHSDIAPSRKNDPGPRFPWFQLYQAGVGAWYDDETLAKHWQIFNSDLPNIGLVQAALSAYGYGIIETGILDRQSIDNLSAFQMHFLPWQVSGNSDARTAAAIFALLEKYFPDAHTALMERYHLERESIEEPLPSFVNQLDLHFPMIKAQSREWVNNRTRFSAYANSGRFSLTSSDATSADIYVNEEKLNIDTPFIFGNIYEYSLEKRTHDGINTLRVANILPQGASVHISIPYPEIGKTTAAPYDFSAVDRLIQDDIENGFPGAVLLVLHKGKIVKHSAYGYARKYDNNGETLNSPLPMQLDTRFDLASNTKVFSTTLAIMKLVNEGKLSLHDLVVTHLPEFIGAGRETRTIEDLLSHASGFDSEVKFFDPNNSLGETFHSLEPGVTKDLLLNKVPFKAGRQTLQTYSDTNFMILGLLVERITGLGLDEYLEDEVYAPLELKSLQFTPLEKGEDPSQFAATELMGNSRGGEINFPNIRMHTLQGEVHDEKAYYSMAGVAGHAGLFGNAQDLAVLAQLLLNGGGYGDVSLVDDNVLRRFTQSSSGQHNIGLGWRLASDKSLAWHFGPYASASAFGHTGWTGTATLIDPEYDLAVILLTNKKHSPTIVNENGVSFLGDTFETGRYGSVMSLVYEAIIRTK